MNKEDRLLAHDMANDIIDCMRLDGAGDGEDLSDRSVIREIVDRYMNAETAPTKKNYNDNFQTPGVWVHWTPGCRYDIDYPAFDKALLEKTGIDASGLLDEEEEKFYTLKNCKMIFNALNPLYKKAKEYVIDMITENPDCIRG